MKANYKGMEKVKFNDVVIIGELRSKPACDNGEDKGEDPVTFSHDAKTSYDSCFQLLILIFNNLSSPTFLIDEG